MLILKNFTVSINSNPVIHNLNLEIQGWSIVLIQGKNGSGKSSLLNVMAGHPFYTMTADEFSYNGNSLIELSPLERAHKGLFLVPQHPPALSGVVFSTFLHESFRALYSSYSLQEYRERLSFALLFLQLPDDFMEKPVHEHFSGGEKKRCELVQLMVLRPSLVLLDELDSGLDVIGVELFIQFLKWYKTVVPDTIIIIVTHSESFTQKIKVDVSYIMDQGQLHEPS